MLAREEAVFGELGSSASVGGPARRVGRTGAIPAGSRVVCTITGNGLKDPDWALSGAPAPTTVPVDARRRRGGPRPALRAARSHGPRA